MKGIKRAILAIPLYAFLLVLNAAYAHAHCPLCTGAIGMVAVSAGYFGIDIVIIGLFVGAFAISTGLWVGRKIKKQYIKFQLQLIVLSSFLLTVLPLMAIGGENLIFLPVMLFGETGSVFNRIYWMDRMLFGGIIGGVISIAGFGIHNYIKKARGRVLFPYQGVVLTLALLAAAAIAFFFVLGK